MLSFVEELVKTFIGELKKIKLLKVIKNCNKCNTDKDVSNFYKKSGRGDRLAGYNHICKDCSRKTTREYNKSECLNKKEYSKNYREDNKEKLDNYIKKWREENTESIKINKNLYYKENKTKILEQVSLYQKERMKNDPLYKLSRGIRALILISFKNQFTKKSKKTKEILGCSFEEFKIYLEEQFDENMNWDNQGSYWHMDHKKPISLAMTEEEVYELNHYTNFQPLYWEDNLSKGNKYNFI